MLCGTNPAVGLTGCRRWSRILPLAGFQELLERRRQLGQDVLDEVWEGVYVMNPAPSEGHADVAQ